MNSFRNVIRVQHKRALLIIESRESTMHYTLKDHQGNLTATVCGNNVERLSYDAWGLRRNPVGFGYGNVTCTFDRGYTLHEHYDDFGLINMNGRMYDPVMSSFLSVDRYVQQPDNSQGFNRYAYCMYNPLKYTDPSGWVMQGGMRPRNPFHDDWSTSHVVSTHGVSDFSNAYYLNNMAFYGNLDGPWGDGGGGVSMSMDALAGTYGYQVSHYANSVYNYVSLYSQMQLIRNWQNNPSYRTNLEIREAGISNVTVGTLFGQVNGHDGYRNSYYHWEDDAGTTHSASECFEYVGGHNSGAYILSNQPLEMYFLSNPKIQNKANILAQSMGVPLGTIENGMRSAAKAYYNIPQVTGRLTKTQAVSALTKEGVAVMNASRLVGRACFAVTTVLDAYQLYDYRRSGGQDLNVYAKGSLDIVMGAVGLFGPIGFGISMTYFVTDWATDSFYGWGKITN